MKKIALTLVLGLSSFICYANPSHSNQAEKLSKIISENSNSAEYFLIPENLNNLTLSVLQINGLENTKKNHANISNALKEYFSSESYKQKSKQDIKETYEKFFTEKELEIWIDFFQSPVGLSYLKNRSFIVEMNRSLEQIIPQNQAPSEQAQQKLSELMIKLSTAR